MGKYLFHYDMPAVADAGDEFTIQVGMRRRIRMIAPAVRMVATPNGMKTTAWAAMRAKAEGMAKGFPDLNIISAGKIAFAEVKDRKGSLSPDQVDWLNWLHEAGFACGCFRSAATLEAFLRLHGFPMLSEASRAA